MVTVSVWSGLRVRGFGAIGAGGDKGFEVLGGWDLVGIEGSRVLGGWGLARTEGSRFGDGWGPVSYTHLTLPTIYSV